MSTTLFVVNWDTTETNCCRSMYGTSPPTIHEKRGRATGKPPNGSGASRSRPPCGCPSSCPPACAPSRPPAAAARAIALVSTRGSAEPRWDAATNRAASQDTNLASCRSLRPRRCADDSFSPSARRCRRRGRARAPGSGPAANSAAGGIAAHMNTITNTNAHTTTTNTKTKLKQIRLLI